MFTKTKLSMLSTVNPCSNTCYLTGWRKIQITVMSATVAPVRLLAVTVTFVSWTAVSKILEVLIDLKKASREQKRRIWYPMSFLCRAMLFCAGFHHIEVRGTRAPTGRARILALAPHRGFFDALLFLAIGGDTLGVVAAAEHVNIPAIGLSLKLSDSILVRRNDPASRKMTVAAIKSVFTSDETDSRQICMFPEGTCHNNQSLMSFKPGAFIPGEPVQLATVEFLNGWDTFSWTMEGPSAAVLFWYTLCQLQSRVRITFLPVYEPIGEEKIKPSLFARNVRAVFSTALKLPVTEHSMLDCKLMEHADKCGLPMSVGCVEMMKLRQMFGIELSQAQVKEVLNNYAQIVQLSGDGDGKCGITLEQFATHLRRPVTNAGLREFFNLCDLNRSGRVDFRGYLIGCNSVFMSCEVSEKLGYIPFDSCE